MRRLFRSQTSYELVRVFSANPSRAFTLGELAKEIQRDPANVSRELAVLQEIGFVLADKKNYQLNNEYALLREVVALFRGLEDVDFNTRFKRPWLLGEEILNICPFFCKIWLNSFVGAFGDIGGCAYERTLAIYRDYHVWFYFDEQDADAVAQHLVKRFAKDVGFMEEANRQIIRCSDELRSFAQSVPDTRLENLSSEQLWQLYKQHEDIHTEYYRWGWIPVAADMFGSQLTEYGKTVLRAHGVPESAVNECLALFTQPTEPSLLKVEQDALLAIAKSVQDDEGQLALFRNLFRKLKEEDVKAFGLYEHTPKYEEHFEAIVRDLVGRIRPDILQAIRDHYATYFYTKFLFTEEQGVYSFEHFLKALVRAVNADVDIGQTLHNERVALQEASKKREQAMREAGISSDEHRFFDAWGTFMVTKIYRRFAQIFALYRMTPILEEIAHRLKLDLKEVKFMMPEEVQAALLRGEISREEVKARVLHSVYYATPDSRTYYTGEQAKRITATVMEAPHQMLGQEVKGQCGCPGVVQGTVKIVNVIEDMQKVRVGDVLVSIATQPDLIPAMKKAIGFVTDQGGVTSHAAIVAREMNKPCVIGTKCATKVLKDGMRVEVDANKGVVRILSS